MKISEITLLGRVKKKGRNNDNLGNHGQRVPVGQEKDYLGKLVGQISTGLDVYADYVSGDYQFHVFDTEKRRATLSLFGTKYPTYNKSLIVSGIYASRDNQVRASKFYHFLITVLGYTLVSDRLQSPGGQRVWQDLERRYHQSVEVYGYDSKTGKVLNVHAGDDSDTHVPADMIGRGTPKDLISIANHVRLVATAK